MTEITMPFSQFKLHPDLLRGLKDLGFARPTPLPGELASWLETFAQSFLRAVPDGDRAGLIEEVSAGLRSRLYEAGRGWVADYVRLRFAAVRG